MSALDFPPLPSEALLGLARAFLPSFGLPTLVPTPALPAEGSLEARIRKVETRYQTLLEKIPAITFLVSFENRQSEIYVSPHIERVLGYTAAEWVENPILWYARLHQSDRQRWNEEFSRTIAYGDAFKGDYRFWAKDGREVWIHGEVTMVRDDAGRPSFLQGLGYDITELKRIQAELGQAKEYAEGIVRGAPTLICGLDPDGRAKFINPAGEELCGYAASELLGKDWWQVLYPGEAAPEGEALRRECLQGQVVNRETTLTRPSGERRIVSWNSVHLRGPDGKVSEIIGLGQDVTARRHAEESQAQLEAQLHQSQRMEALGVLSRGIAHDFNNILGSMTVFAELVTDDVPPDSRARKNLDSLVRAAQRAGELVKQIMAFSRGLQTERSRVRITPVIEDTIKLIRSTLPRSITLETVLTARNDWVVSNPVQIGQIVMNLSGNAEHAMRGHEGRLRISLEEAKFDNPAAAAGLSLQPGDYLRLAIGDTGHGIDPATLKRIFEPFFTTKKVGEGTGLGLSVVHGIVRSHGGDIRVTSEVGRGTLFEIFLPIATS